MPAAATLRNVMTRRIRMIRSSSRRAITDCRQVFGQPSRTRGRVGQSAMSKALLHLYKYRSQLDPEQLTVLKIGASRPAPTLRSYGRYGRVST